MATAAFYSENHTFTRFFSKAKSRYRDSHSMKGVSILLLYMITIEFLDIHSLSVFLLKVWRSVIMESEEKCRVVTQFVVTLLSLFDSKEFKQL